MQGFHRSNTKTTPTYYKPEGDSTAEREAMIDKAVADGYNVLVLPGYAFAEAIVAAAELYPEVKFGSWDSLRVRSLHCSRHRYLFTGKCLQRSLPGRDSQAGVAGYAAVKMGYTKLGFLGGMAVPAVIRYGYGFVAGANDAAKEMGLTDVAINYDIGNQFYGDADITAAMDTWYKGGTEVVFACGGGIYTHPQQKQQHRCRR